MTARVCCFPDCTIPVGARHIVCAHPDRVRREVQIRLRVWKDQGAAREFVVSWVRISRINTAAAISYFVSPCRSEGR